MGGGIIGKEVRAEEAPFYKLVLASLSMHRAASQGAIPPHSFSTCPDYTQFQQTASAIPSHLLLRIHISQPSSTYFTFPDLGKLQGRQPPGKRIQRLKVSGSLLTPLGRNYWE